jgi:hypothetical protein
MSVPLLEVDEGQSQGTVYLRAGRRCACRAEDLLCLLPEALSRTKTFRKERTVSNMLLSLRTLPTIADLRISLPPLCFPRDH